MKIYNVIEWKWNDKTNKMEEVYSDGYEYEGPIDLLAEEDEIPTEDRIEITPADDITPPSNFSRERDGTLVNTNLTNMCESGQQDPCCQISDYLTIWTNPERTEYTLMSENRSSPMDPCPVDYISSPMLFFNGNVQGGNQPGICCIPDNAHFLEFEGGFVGNPLDIGWGSVGYSTQVPSDGNALAFIELASLETFGGLSVNNPPTYGDIPNMFPPIQSTSNMLCDMTEGSSVENLIQIDACGGFGDGSSPGMSCFCESNVWFNEQPGDCEGYIPGGNNCDFGIPCGLNSTENYCSTFRIEPGTAPGSQQCSVTDQCGICGDDGSECTDCAGVPMGDSRIDLCGNCVDCGDASAYSGGIVAWDGGSDCEAHQLWNMRCTGCIQDTGVCNSHMSVLVDDITGESIPCVSLDANDDEINICTRDADALGGGNYCPDPGEPGYGSVPGCCWSPTSYCDCSGSILDPLIYCDCNGNVYDDCGGCVATTLEAKEVGQWIDNEAPLIINGIIVGTYSTPNHLDGLYNYNTAAGSVYCDCDGNQTQVLNCYDTTDPNETLLEVMACSDDINCSDFNTNYVNTLGEAQDPGCLDDLACNYNPSFDFDCGGNIYVDRESSDTSCCIYPVLFCKSLGEWYANQSDAIEDSGYQWGCDVLGPDAGENAGKPVELRTFCPLCTSQDYGNSVQSYSFSFDINQPYNATTETYRYCLQSGYPDDIPYTGFNGIEQIDTNNLIDLVAVLIQDGFNPLPNTEYWMPVAPPPEITGWGDDLPKYLKDTCEQSTNSCGPFGMEPGGDYTLQGCADVGALNNQAGTGALPIYWDANFPQSMNSETPVETCDYCPNQPSEYNAGLSEGGCVGGYEFMWSAYINGTGISSQASVSSGGDSNPNPYFYLGDIQSNVILQSDSVGYNSGHCYCRDDLEFLRDVGQLITDNPSSTNNHNNATDHPLNIIRGYTGGTMVWNEFGRLVEFVASPGCGGAQLSDIENCQNSYLQAEGPLPQSIQYANKLRVLDLSYGKFNGAIPQNLEFLTNLTELNLSYNKFTSIPEGINGHGIYDGQYRGLCALIQLNSTGMGQEIGPIGNNIYRPTIEGTLDLRGNRICPNSGNVYLNYTTYPECLAPIVDDALYVRMGNPNDDFADQLRNWENWIYTHLGFIDLPNYSGFNDSDPYPPAQFIENGDGSLDCPLEGCTDPRAQNYWPEATQSCGADNYCCQYDDFLHFPWGDGQDGIMNNEYGDNPLGGGSFGGGMTLYEMVQALHAPICGFQYNSFGDVDVTNTPSAAQQNLPDACEFDSFYYEFGYLPDVTVNGCEFSFANNSIDGNAVIDIWDGLWLRSWSGYQGDSSHEYCTNISGEPIRGDARPLEFIQRVGQIAFCDTTPNDVSDGEFTGCDPSLAQYWFGLAFPLGFANYSYEGIEYWEDYLITGGENPSLSDIEAWRQIGRIDIAIFIQQWINGEVADPPRRPDNVELWEQAPVSVDMTYSQKFISEAEAGFTLYPEENSPGVLRRSGQFQCSDGGPADICYTNIEACGIAPSWVDECIPCGDVENGSGGTCIPLTVDVAAEGYEKITKTKTINVPYFHNGLSSTIKGKNLFTASMSSSNHSYFYGVTNGFPNLATSETQFDVSFGHIKGSGSKVTTDTSGSGNIGATEAVYKQYASLLLDDEDIGFDTGSYFKITSGSDIGFVNGKQDEMIYALNFKRKKFEDQLENGTWTLSLHGTGSEGNEPKTIHLTDNSLVLEKPTIKGNGGRRFDIISGSAGTPYDGYSNIGDRYGWFYPDAGCMIFGEKLIYAFSGSMGNDVAQAEFNPTLIGQSGSKQLYPDLSSDRDGKNALRFINLMRGMNTETSLNLTGQKEVSEVTYVCRLAAEDFNFTNNFSILSGSGRVMFGENADPGLMNGFNTSTTASVFLHPDSSSVMITGSEQNSSYPNSIGTAMVDQGGQVFNWPGANVSTMHGNPHSFITGIQMYDEHGEMVAVANLNKPLKKASDREVVIKVKLIF